MKFGVVVFPGSNCDDDMIHVLGTVMGHDVKKIWHKEETLEGFTEDDCIVIPGGFSYGDYLRSGAIARFSPIMKAVIAFAERGGKVIGICNGFQVLCEAGLLPGALLGNSKQKFICKNVHLRVESTDSLFTNQSKKGDVLKIPIAHADGRYYIGEEGLKDLLKNDQVVFRYSSEEGSVSDESNINGSVESIAGVTNKARNVLGMMPHPERASEEELGNTEGRIMFEALTFWVNAHA